MDFRDEIQAAKKNINQIETVESNAQKLTLGIRNHVLSMASNVQQGKAFSCEFDICLGTVKIDYLSVKDISGYLSKKEISKTDGRIAELYRRCETEISLYSEAFELHSLVQKKLKMDNIKVSDIFIGDIGGWADISEGDYIVGWKQNGVVFDISNISQKISTVYGNDKRDPNTVVPCGKIAERYSYNPRKPLICLHNYKKGLFGYTANAYLAQDDTNELMASTDRHHTESTTIAFCFRVEYTDN